MKRTVACLSITAVLVLSAFSSGAAAKSTGACPKDGNWELVTLGSLGLTPGDATGIPSLDGNQDGLTCIKPLTPTNPAAPVVGGFVFRDNTVG
ncbi:MAG: hypothetical protein H0U16_10885 [Actinobacteria bacterium]|nr:hypothetical protein [Actinomycetota bacterium]